MAKKETLHFQYESIDNIIRLLVTIQFENTCDKRDITVFHQRFRHEPDKIFGKFAKKLYPNGGTIDKSEIENIVEYVRNFLQKDEKSKDLYAAYDKQYYKSYVYFKPDKKVYYAETGNHMNIVIRICCDFFKEFGEIGSEYLHKFILENFEIKSEFTTLTQIADNDDFIRDAIEWQNHRKKEKTDVQSF